MLATAALILALDPRWAAEKAPARGPAEAIGAYTNGCVRGAVPLVPDGPGYRVLHLGRRRNYGHPALVSYVRRLGRAVKKRGLGFVLVGDLGQPRGGPTPFGHRSHQSGLDVDIGYVVPPELLRRGRLGADERERLQPPAIVDLGTKEPTGAFRPEALTIVELAARDPNVDRVFVHPTVKRKLCEAAKPGSSVWLARVRPWWGHHDHLHVRLACPEGSPACIPMDPIEEGDGCGESLAWWFRDESQAARTKRQAAAATEPEPVVPTACEAVSSRPIP